MYIYIYAQSLRWNLACPLFTFPGEYLAVSLPAPRGRFQHPSRGLSGLPAWPASRGLPRCSSALRQPSGLAPSSRDYAARPRAGPVLRAAAGSALRLRLLPLLRPPPPRRPRRCGE